MQEWFCKLIGSFQRFIHEDSPHLNGQGSFSPRGMHASFTQSMNAGVGPSPRSQSSYIDTSNHSSRNQDDGLLRGSGLVFEHNAFVSHRCGCCCAPPAVDTR